jgi:hypothetical protein
MSLVFAVSALALPGARTFAQTYPAASPLCVRADQGTLGRRLEANKDQVLGACSKLEAPFAALEVTVTGAETQYAQTASKEAALVLAACPQPVTRAERPTCHTARLTRRAADSSARLTRHDAVVAFVASVEANRIAFWTEVNSLR